MESRRILLVENLATMGHVIGAYLMDAGFEIARVTTPDEATERLELQQPDLIIFNTGLPAELKSSYINRWRAVAPATKILEISEYPLIVAGGSLLASEIGAADMYVQIPFDFDKLPDFVAECLDGG